MKGDIIMKLKIVTYNLRSIWKGDGINGFIHRAGMIFDKINKELPDIIAFQEAIPEHINFLKTAFPQYHFTGHGREEGYDGEGVFTAILRETMMEVGNETVWISPTPYIIASKFEKQSGCSRACNITQVRNRKTGNLYRIFNIHLDHAFAEARVEGMKCVLDFVDRKNSELSVPTVILGDFNAEPGDEEIEIINNHGKYSDITAHIPYTFHNYGNMQTKIDYIYISDDIKNNLKSVYIWDDVDNGIYLSDHYPVCAEFEE